MSFGGQQGSNCVKPRKHDISRREDFTDLIFGVQVYHNEYKKHIVLVEVKDHLGSTRVEFENLLNTISQVGKLGQLSYLVYHIEYKSLLFLVEVKGHLGSSDIKL